MSDERAFPMGMTFRSAAAANRFKDEYFSLSSDQGSGSLDDSLTDGHDNL